MPDPSHAHHTPAPSERIQPYSSRVAGGSVIGTSSRATVESSLNGGGDGERAGEQSGKAGEQQGRGAGAGGAGVGGESGGGGGSLVAFSGERTPVRKSINPWLLVRQVSVTAAANPASDPAPDSDSAAATAPALFLVLRTLLLPLQYHCRYHCSSSSCRWWWWRCCCCYHYCHSNFFRAYHCIDDCYKAISNKTGDFN